MISFIIKIILVWQLTKHGGLVLASFGKILGAILGVCMPVSTIVFIIFELTGAISASWLWILLCLVLDIFQYYVYD